jgi:glycosyltransferase involved in cell wall biosynthesis
MILLIVASLPASLTNFRGPLIAELIAQGHTVHAAAPNLLQDGATSTKLQIMGAIVHNVPLSRTGLNPFADIMAFWAILRLIVSLCPDLVLTYTIKPNIWGAFAAKAAGVRSVAMVTGLGYAFTDSNSFPNKVSKLIAAQLYRLATGFNDKVIFQNPDDLADFIAAGCLSKTCKARLVNGSGVDTDHYALTQLPDAPVFLMISRLLGNKGVREYARAGIATKSIRPNSRFLLVGYLDKGPDCVKASEVDDWIAGGIEYLGPMEDVRDAIGASSIYVLPSYREGTPRSVLEAMSMGRPIITTDAPGCRETTVENENGYLVPVKDTEILTQRMVALTDNSDLRYSMGMKSRNIAVAKYDVNAVNSVLIKHIGI